MATPRHPPAWLNPESIRAFLRTLIAWGSNGGKLESYQVAMARAEICRKCPMNVAIPGCSLECEAIYGFTRMALGRRRLPLDAQLHHCQVCRCYNAASVWFPMAAKRAGITPEMNAQFPPGCWQKEADQSPQENP